MPDYYGARIAVGGVVDLQGLLALVRAAWEDGAGEVLLPAAVRAALPAECATGVGTTDEPWLVAGGHIPWGMFCTLEEAAQDLGLAYDRYTQPGYGDPGVLRRHRPGLGSFENLAGHDGAAVLSAPEAERLIAQTRDRRQLVAALRSALGCDLPPLPPLRLSRVTRCGHGRTRGT